jgi:glycosyltransferase involved in cell wall biosynthesis
VVIPTYNRAHYIAESIQSVLDQTYRDFELIIVDDGSTDNTKEVVSGFKDPRIRYIYQERRGVAAAANVGIKASTGEYIGLMASDDIWLPRYLELQLALLDSHPETSVVCSDMYIFDSDTGTSLGRLWQDKSDRYLRETQDGIRQPLTEFLSRGALFTTQTSIINHKVFHEVGYLDESLPNGNEDYDMFVRILHRFSIGIVNQPLAKYRRHRDSLSRNFEQLYRGRLAVINKMLNNYSLSDEHIKLVQRRLARTHCEYGWEKIRESGGVVRGREKLLAAIRVNPWWPRPYLYLAFSLLGNRAIQTLKSMLKSWKKWLVSRPVTVTES